MSHDLHNFLVVLAVSAGVLVAAIGFFMLCIAINDIAGITLFAGGIGYAICDIRGWLK